MAGNNKSGRRRMVVEIPNTVIAHLHKTERFTADDYARLILRHNQGKSSREIAKEMGRTVGAIEGRLHKVRHKFASMRKLDSWPGIERITMSLKNGTTGCKYHANCDTCPFPACCYDGYDPTYEPPAKGRKEKRWTASDIQHWNELERLPYPLDDATLANIFRTTVPVIQEFKDARRNA